jgi:hypothetical protein
MSIEEKNEIKKSAYTEALRYIQNAKENLHKAKKHGKYYQDIKYVRSASGIAYSGMLLALDALLKIKNIHPAAKNRKSIDWYRDQLRRMDWKLLNDVNTTYEALHLIGYYEGTTSVKIIDAGLEGALSVIKHIKPTVN